MMNVMNLSVSCLTAVAFAAPAFAAPGDVLFSDDFETGSISNYTVVEGGTFFDTSAVTYGFDLATLGSGFTGSGLLLETDDAITAFVNGVTVNTIVSIKFDAYASAVSGGSTEYLTAGVAGGGTAAFDEDGGYTGVFTAASTDSDFGAAGDFAVFEGPGGTADALSFMDAADVADSGTAFATILPEVPGQFAAGNLNDRMVEVEILTDGSRLQWFIDGFQLTDVLATSAVVSGTVGIGINDPFEGSNNGGGAGSGTGTAFAIDNLLITESAGFVEIPEPTTLGLAAAGLALLAGRRRRNA